MWRTLSMAALALGACGGTPAVGVHEGQRAPRVSGEGLEGATVDVGAAQTPEVVVFWASWCGPCRREAPSIVALDASYAGRLAVTWINMAEDPVTTRAAATALGLGDRVVLDPDGALAGQYQVTSVPTLLVLDKDGVVRFRGHDLPGSPHALIDGLL